jgi:hypothetical protein
VEQIEISKNGKIYLMIAGSLIPAFIGILVHGMYHKRFAFRSSDILIFAVLSMFGGYYSAKILEKN